MEGVAVALAEAAGWERLVIGGLRRVQADDSDEAWERDIEVDDGEARWVGAARVRAGELLGDGPFLDGWNVTVAAMEFVREEPLEGVLRRRIAAALQEKPDGRPPARTAPPHHPRRPHPHARAHRR